MSPKDAKRPVYIVLLCTAKWYILHPGTFRATSGRHLKYGYPTRVEQSFDNPWAWAQNEQLDEELHKDSNPEHSQGIVELRTGSRLLVNGIVRTANDGGV